MPVQIAGITLDRIHRMTTLEQAAFVNHRIPGLDGTVVQDMGRDSVRLQIEGIFFGDSAQENVEQLRDIYKTREPVDFLAEIVGQAYFAQVILEQFQVVQAAGDPGQFSYVLTVSEYVQPPEPAAAGPSAIDMSILDEAQSFMDIATLPDLLGSIPEVTNPIEPLNSAMDGVKKATEGLGPAAEGLKMLFGV